MSAERVKRRNLMPRKRVKRDSFVANLRCLIVIPRSSQPEAAPGRSADAPRPIGSMAFVVALFVAGLLLAAPAAQAAVPSAATGEATEVHFNQATLNGTVNPGGAELEECQFEYGETEEPYEHMVPCAETPGEIGSGASDVTVNAEISGLTATSTYHFRLTAKGPSGTAHGSDQPFNTPAGPEWKLTVTPYTNYVISGSEDPGEYKLEAENVGVAATSGLVTLQAMLPSPLSASVVAFYDSEIGYPNSAALCPTTEKCEFPGLLELFGIKSLQPHQRLIMTVVVPVPSSFVGPIKVGWKVSGGGAQAAEASATNEANPEPPFGELGFNAAITDASKTSPYTQAGGHPYQVSTEFNFETYACEESGSGDCPMHDPKDITADLPPGLLANPQGVPHCPLASYFNGECERNKVVVGWAGLRPYAWNEGAFRFVEPIYNLQPEASYPGQLGITVGGAPFIVITTNINPSGGYGVTATNVAIEAGLNRVRLTLWGVPADPEHDQMRGKECWASWGPSEFSSAREIEERCEAEGGSHSAEVPLKPFLTMPTECSGVPLDVGGRYDAWADPGVYAEAIDAVPAVDGCSNLSFEPTIEARPTTNVADAPSGFEFNLHVPQNEDPEGVATPELKETAVKLPAGFTLNPAGAEGLGGCSEAQIGLHTDEPAHCPDASKLGTAEVNTKLLSEPLKGFLYLATPHQNPSGALLAGYIALEGQGVNIKLPGHFETDPQTGQITTEFLENPQLPFENLKLDIFGGALGALRTPTVCGSYETTTSLTPFSAPESGPPATPSSTFETTVGPGGGECLYEAHEEPNAPRYRAGTETPQAGIYSPLSLKLVREDGSQEMKSLETTLPPGLVGRLAGTPYCPDAALAAAAAESGTEEKASPSCPAASEVGTVDVTAGVGPTPINVSGRVYLAGPYQGAPLSVAIVTPALAGPFDLGTVVVRAALYVNPETAQITAKSDPIPTILEGIPLDVRSITLKMSRPNFTLNPTNCNELAFTGSALSILGAAAPLSQRFQVGGCQALAFKPKLALRLTGGTKRSQNPALHATLTAKPGEANIASTSVTLPPTELLDNAHIKNPCTRVVFAQGSAPGERCPPGSVIGFAKAETPLLEKPLEGPVYLRSAPENKSGLPDVVAALNGQIDITLDGKISTVHGGLRTTFGMVPDAPVTKFTLNLDGGRKGLLENSPNLCRAPQSTPIQITGQNGKSQEANPLLKASCPRHAKKHKSHHKRRTLRAAE